MTSCSCIDSNCDGEASDVLFEKIVKAKKPHECNECGEIINKGDRYEYFKGISDGRLFTHKTCLDCLSLRNAYFCSWLFGELWNSFREDIEYNGGNICLEPMAKLTPKAKEKACKIIEEHWREDVD